MHLNKKKARIATTVVVVAIIIVSVCLSIGLSGCSSNDNSNDKYIKIYDQYVEYRTVKEPLLIDSYLFHNVTYAYLVVKITNKYSSNINVKFKGNVYKNGELVNTVSSNKTSLAPGEIATLRSNATKVAYPRDPEYTYEITGWEFFDV